MHITKGETRNFNDYEICQVITKKSRRSLWQVLEGIQPTEEVETKLEGVIEADDATGLLVQQIYDVEHRAIYTNGTDDIVLDNTCKLLMLLPNIRQAFHGAGFRPKLSRTYKDKLKIHYKGPALTETKKVVEVVQTAVEVTQ